MGRSCSQTNSHTRFPPVKILPNGGLDNEESVGLASSTADRSTIQKHRTGENNEEYAMIYNKSERVQMEVAR